MASGKQFDQKMKPHLVNQYLMKHSDENNVVTTSELVAYLQEIGISAERRSIYRDIEEINKAILISEELTEDIDEACELIEDDEDENRLTLTTKIEVSDQFFGWLCGFGRRVTVLAPDSVVEKFKSYIDKIRGIY